MNRLNILNSCGGFMLSFLCLMSFSCSSTNDGEVGEMNAILSVEGEENEAPESEGEANQEDDELDVFIDEVDPEVMTEEPVVDGGGNEDLAGGESNEGETETDEDALVDEEISPYTFMSVDSGNINATSMAIRKGNIFVAYQERDQNQLRYASNLPSVTAVSESSDFNVSVVQEGTSETEVGFNPRIILDDLDNAHIIFGSKTLADNSGNVRYAWSPTSIIDFKVDAIQTAKRAADHFGTADDPMGILSGLSYGFGMTPDRSAWVAAFGRFNFSSGENTFFTSAKSVDGSGWTSDAWVTATLNSKDYYGSNSVFLFIDEDWVLHLFYDHYELQGSGQYEASIRHAKIDYATLDLRSIETLYISPSIQLKREALTAKVSTNSAYKMAVSIFDEAAQSLQVISKDKRDTSWSNDWSLMDSSIGPHHSVALDESGVTYLSYYSSESLLHGNNESGTMEIEPIERNGDDVGQSNVTKVDSRGGVYILYFNASTEMLEIAYQSTD